MNHLIKKIAVRLINNGNNLYNPESFQTTICKHTGFTATFCEAAISSSLHLLSPLPCGTAQTSAPSGTISALALKPPPHSSTPEPAMCKPVSSTTSLTSCRWGGSVYTANRGNPQHTHTHTLTRFVFLDHSHFQFQEV